MKPASSLPSGPWRADRCLHKVLSMDSAAGEARSHFFSLPGSWPASRSVSNSRFSLNSSSIAAAVPPDEYDTASPSTKEVVIRVIPTSDITFQPIICYTDSAS